MKKSIRLISALLTVLTVLTSVGIGSIFTASAATPAFDYLTTEMSDQLAKLSKMTLKRSQNGYNLYCDEYTGEVALQKIATGQILFSNPYDVASMTAANSASTREKLLSQIFIEYEDSDGTTKTMYSYAEAATRGQIIVKNIKNGIRVEYTMGRQEARRLVPRMIQKERLETLIIDKIDNQFLHDKLYNFYILMDPDDPDLSERAVAAMKAKYPITNKMAIYVYDSNASDYELNTCESIIKTYCPDYTYETLDEDHAMTEYEGQDSAPPLFRLALEYTLDDDGLEVRLPANGIRFDDTAYKLLSVTMLPYMGCINSEYDGYTFMPDGAGALFTAKDLKGITWNRAGQMYGPDYAYQTITGEHQEVLTVPVWGAVSYTDGIKTDVIETVIEEGYTYTDEETGEEVVVDPVVERDTIVSEYTENKGYVAIITEGDSLATIVYENGGSLHKYAAIYAEFCPRPSDEYNLAEAISAASNATWRVESSRKYVDSYRIRYIMLDGDAEAAAAGITDYYETSYFGMAEAYREYLEKTGVLTRITSEDVTENIPLYIEVLGSIETTERILSIPVTVDTPLTTFENIKTMYEDLSAKGIDTVNFKLTGFANGGLSDPTVPYKLKWEKSVGGADGFTDLMNYVSDKNVEIFPDFDFLYAPNNKAFDGFTYRKHAVKTIDDRYTSKRYYDATTQSYTRNFEIAISTSVLDRFYTKLNENYQKYEPSAISVSTLGTDLNSDFDEDDPYNREDSKLFTTEVLAKISEDYDQVMVDGGNAYTFKYVDHIVNMNLNSSEFFNASYSVPFTGLVLHGYIKTAGTAANEEGDIEKAILRSIETGSSLNFTLAYQNTSALKEDEHLNKYYSVRYDIWFDDMVEYYTYLNSMISDLQDKLIVGHKLLEGERVPDEDEIEADRIAAEKAAEEAAKRAEEEAAKLEKEEKLAERKEAEALAAEIEAAPADTAALVETVNEYLATVRDEKTALDALLDSIANVKSALDLATADVETATAALADAEATEDAEAIEAATTALADAEEVLKTAQADYDDVISSAKKSISAIEGVAEKAEAAVETADRKLSITDNASVASNAAIVKSVAASIESVASTAGAEYDAKAELYGFAEEKVEEPDNTDEPDEDSVPGNDRFNRPEAEEVSKYAVTDGSIVLVTYEGGISFILNYNRFDVTVEVDGTTYTVEGYTAIRISE